MRPLHVVVLVAALITVIGGATINVAGFSVTDIRNAVKGAQAGDTIVVGAGTYTGCVNKDGNNSTIVLPDALTHALPGEQDSFGFSIVAPQGATIDCERNCDDPTNAFQRLFDFRPATVKSGSDDAADPYRFALTGGTPKPSSYVGIGGWIEVRGLTIQNICSRDETPSLWSSYYAPNGDDGGSNGAVVAFTSLKTRFVDCTFQDITSLPAIGSGPGGGLFRCPTGLLCNTFLLSGGLFRGPVNGSLHMTGNFFTNIEAYDGDRYDVDRGVNAQPYYGGLIEMGMFTEFIFTNNYVSNCAASALILLSACTYFDLYPINFPTTNGVLQNPVPCRATPPPVTISNSVFIGNTGTPIHIIASQANIQNVSFIGTTAYEVPDYAYPNSVATSAWTAIFATQSVGVSVTNWEVRAFDTNNVNPGVPTKTVYPATVTISNSRFLGQLGRSIEIMNATNYVTISNTDFWDSNALMPPRYGDAAVIYTSGDRDSTQSLIITGCRFRNNTVEGPFSGVIWVAETAVKVSDSQFVDTHAMGVGGVLFCTANAQGIDLTNNISVSGTSSDNTFGAAYCSGGCGCCASSEIFNLQDNTNAVVDPECLTANDAPCPYTCLDPDQEPAFDSIACLAGSTYQPSNNLCINKPCAVPTIANGGVDAFQTVVAGCTMSVHCNEGFGLDGYSVLYCQGPAFNATVPSCINVTCLTLPNPLHGAVAVNGLVYNSLATYTCDVGYELKGSVSRYCVGINTWSDAAPTCEAAACQVVNSTLYDGSCTEGAITVLSNATCALSCQAGTVGVSQAGLRCVQSHAGAAGSLDGILPSCTECNAGTYAVAGAPACSVCGNGYTRTTKTTKAADCLCNAGFYEDPIGSGTCVACPAGATCLGDKYQHVAATGYILSNGQYVACRPAVACAGNQTCAPGYEGYLCGFCEDGYYQLNGECITCPHSASWQIVVGIIGGTLVTLFMVVLVQPNGLATLQINIASPAIIISFLQTISIFADIDFPWGEQLRRVFQVFSFFNVNFEILNIQCVTKFSYYDKLLTQLIAPIAVLGLFIIVGSGLSLFRCFKARARGGFKREFINTVMEFAAGYLLFLTLVYMYLVRASFAYFSCFKQTDGSYTLSVAPGETCFTNQWNAYLAAPILGIVFYVVGIPLALWASFLIVQRKFGEYATGTHPLTSFFVNKYRGPTWYWELLVMLRKLLIVFFTLYFVQSVTGQAVANSIVLLVACLLTLTVHPFLWDKHDYVEAAALVACLLGLFGGIVMNSPGITTAQIASISIVIIVVIGIIIAITVGSSTIELYVRIREMSRARTAKKSTCTDTLTHEGSHGMTRLLAEGETNTLVTGTVSGEAVVWDAITKAETSVVASGDRIVGMGWLEGGKLLVTAARDGTLGIHRASDGATLAKTTYSSGVPRCLAVAGHRVYVGDDAGKLVIYAVNVVSEATDGGEVSFDEADEWALHDAPINHIVLVEPCFVYTASGQRVTESNVETRETTASWSFRGKITSFVLEGKLLYAASTANEVVSVNITRGAVVRHFSGHPSAVTCVALLGDNLFTGCGDATIRMWSIETGFPLQILSGHSASVVGLHATASPTGASLWSVGAEGELRHWNVDYALNMAQGDEVRETTLRLLQICRKSPQVKDVALEEYSNDSVAVAKGKIDKGKSPKKISSISRKKQPSKKKAAESRSSGDTSEDESNDGRSKASRSRSGSGEGSHGPRAHMSVRALDEELSFDVARPLLEHLSTKQKRALVAKL